MTACIRIATAGDAPEILGIYAPIVRETAISFELEPPTLEEVQSRVESTITRFPWLVCKHKGRVAGYAYASTHRARAAYQWSADVSVYNHEDYRGMGVGRALYTSLLEIVAAQGYRNVCAGIALPNAASVALHEAMGFKPVGVYPDIGYKLGAWHPVGWWQATLSSSEEEPSPPVPLPQLAESPAIAQALARGTALLDRLKG
jgi:phosphinothricin acetyltransferase